MDTKPRLFVREGISAIVLLVIQYVLGMYINLFVTFPTSGPADAWRFAWRTIPVAAHILLGTLMFLVAITLLIRSIRIKNRHWIRVAIIGTVALALAVTGGELFVSTQSEIASYLMSLGFVAAIIDMSWGVFTA